jgi:hypothetical protein
MGGAAIRGFAQNGLQGALSEAAKTYNEQPALKTLEPDEANKLYAPEGEKLFTQPVYEHCCATNGIGARTADRAG